MKEIGRRGRPRAAAAGVGGRAGRLGVPEGGGGAAATGGQGLGGGGDGGHLLPVELGRPFNRMALIKV